MRKKMKYEDYINKIGLKYNIVEGKLVEDPDNGVFTVSTTLAYNTIYLNKFNKTAELVTHPNSWIGRTYKFRKSDCVTLAADYYDSIHNTDLSRWYKNFSHEKWFEYYKIGMSKWFTDHNFIEVPKENLKDYDFIVYSYNDRAYSHIAIYLGNDKILHHLPQSLSCYDNLDRTKILGVYRYGN